MKCCRELASNGLCRNVPFVSQNCKFSCDAKCRAPTATEKPTTSTPTTTTTTATTTITPTTPMTITATAPNSSCTDKLKICEIWAVLNQYCKEIDGCCSVNQYKTYMSKSCKKSCGLC